MAAMESIMVMASGLGVSRNPADYIPMLLFLGTLAVAAVVFKKLKQM